MPVSGGSSGGGAVSSVVGQTGAVTGSQILADATVNQTVQNYYFMTGVR